MIYVNKSAIDAPARSRAASSGRGVRAALARHDRTRAAAAVLPPSVARLAALGLRARRDERAARHQHGTVEVLAGRDAGLGVDHLRTVAGSSRSDVVTSAKERDAVTSLAGDGARGLGMGWWAAGESAATGPASG